MKEREGGGTYDVEPEDLDTVILLVLGRLLPRIELLPLVYPTSQPRSGGGIGDRRTDILATAVTPHGERGHETDDHLRVPPDLASLDLGRIKIRREVFLLVGNAIS